MDTAQDKLIFVYGTLKRGFANHYLLKDAVFSADSCTQEVFPMVIAGPWFAPSMLDQPGDGRQIHGELYQVDEQVLAQLDRLERVGQAGGYIRRQISVFDTNDPSRHYSCGVYLKPLPFQEQIHSAGLSVYDDTRYIAPHLRDS